MGYDLGSYFAGAGKGILEGLTGIKPDGFYRNTVSDTGQVLGVDSSGKSFVINDNDLTPQQREMQAQKRREIEQKRLIGLGEEKEARDLNRTLSIITKQQAPVLAQLQASTALQNRQVGLAETNSAASIANANEQTRLMRDKMEKDAYVRATELGIQSELARNNYVLGEKQLALAKENNENANIARINQQTLDQHATKMQSIQSAIALMARGLAGAF